MKWFKKLFPEKYEKVNGASPSRKEVIEEKNGMMVAEFVKNSDGKRNFVALTTIKNFHYEMLVDHNVQCEWMLTTKEDIMSPRFRAKFSKDNLTKLCKKMAQSKPIHVTTIDAPPPLCHCDQLESSNGICVAKHTVSPLHKFIKFLKKFWCKLCNTFKKCNHSEQRRTDTIEYICRCNKC